MKTARQVIAEAMNDEKMMYDSDEANADQIIAALESAGFNILPPNHVQLPKTRHEAEVMNCISERFLKEPVK